MIKAIKSRSTGSEGDFTNLETVEFSNQREAKDYLYAVRDNILSESRGKIEYIKYKGKTCEIKFTYGAITRLQFVEVTE